MTNTSLLKLLNLIPQLLLYYLKTSKLLTKPDPLSLFQTKLILQLVLFGQNLNIVTQLPSLLGRSIKLCHCLT